MNIVPALSVVTYKWCLILTYFWYAGLTKNVFVPRRSVADGPERVDTFLRNVGNPVQGTRRRHSWHFTKFSFSLVLSEVTWLLRTTNKIET
jgi:hypothetical protein